MMFSLFVFGSSAAVSAQRTVEHVKSTLRNIMNEGTPQIVVVRGPKSKVIVYRADWVDGPQEMETN